MPEAPDGRARAAGVLAGNYAPALAVGPGGADGAPLASVAMPGVSYAEVEAA